MRLDESCNKIEMKPSPACIARLLRQLLRRGRSHEDAEDLIQDAFVRLAEYCRTAEVRNEAAFLERTVANLSIDRYRHYARHPSVDAPIEELAETLPLLDPQPAPDEVCAAQERLDTVTRVLDAVGTRTREVYLAHRAGYSHRELAAEFGVSISTIEKDIARAVVALMDMRDPQ